MLFFIYLWPTAQSHHHHSVPSSFALRVIDYVTQEARFIRVVRQVGAAQRNRVDSLTGQAAVYCECHNCESRGTEEDPHSLPCLLDVWACLPPHYLAHVVNETLRFRYKYSISFRSPNSNPKVISFLSFHFELHTSFAVS